MDSRKLYRLAQIPVVVSVLALGCQPAIELDFVRPGLSVVQPVAAETHRGDTGLRLQTTLLGTPSWWALSTRERVQVGDSVFALNELKSDDFTVSMPAVGPVSVRGLTHQPWGESLALGVIVDNSESAGRVDPAGERLVLVARLMGSLQSMLERELLRRVRVTVVLLQAGGAAVVLQDEPPAQVIARLVAPPPAGRAALFDGVVHASQPLAATEQRVLVLYWGSSGDVASTYTEDQAAGAARAVPVLAVRGPGADGLATRLAELGGGILLDAPVASAIADAAPVLTSRLRGVWVLDLTASAALDGLSSAEGQVSLQLAPDARWTRAFRLPLLRP